VIVIKEEVIGSDCRVRDYVGRENMEARIKKLLHDELYE
jgi:hypothetical protein